MDEETSLGLSAKDRRKLKREEKKKLTEERAALLSKTQASPPGERTSVFGMKFPTSVETEWSHYEPIGWSHVAESYTFRHTYAQCQDTKLWYPLGDILQLFEGGQVGPVAAKKYTRCAYSGSLIKKEDGVEVFMDSIKKGIIHKSYIGNDFKKCDATGDFYQNQSLIRILGSEKYNFVARKFCVNGNSKQVARQCAGCSRAYEMDMVPFRATFNDYECESCFEIKTMGSLIHAHDYAVYPPPLFTPRTTRRMVGGEEQTDGPWKFFIGNRKLKNVPDPAVRLFGVECETEIHRKSAEKKAMTRNKLAREVLKVLGEDFVIIKEDGTLTANQHYSKATGYSGFEIVTCPADLGVHRQRWPQLYTMDGFKDGKTGYFRAWDEYDTCGFHVHVSRASLTDFQIGRMLDFINNKANAKFVHMVAGRGSDRFCKYIPKEPGDKTHPITDVFHPTEKVISREEDNPRNRSRRVALNLSNKKTVEFRIFRGTIHPRHIVRNIEFCDAVCDYCYPAARSYRDMADYKNFIKFVESNKKSYPFLAEWFANQKMIAMKAFSEKANKTLLTINPENSVETTRPEKTPEVDPWVIKLMPATASAPATMAVNPDWTTIKLTPSPAPKKPARAARPTPTPSDIFTYGSSDDGDV